MMNWDADYRTMADTFLEQAQRGITLASLQISEATETVAAVKHKSGNAGRLAELAVAWVLSNPAPINLDPPPYKR